jgi:hypothetical protein
METLFKRYSSTGMPEEKVSELRAVYAKFGWQRYWRAQLDRLKSLPTQGYTEPYLSAWLCIRAGEKDQAFEWLEKAYHNRSPWMPTVKYDPLLDSLRLDTRFQQLVQRVEFTP